MKQAQFNKAPFGSWHWSLESGIGIRRHQYRCLDVTRIANWKRERIPHDICFTCPHPRANWSPAPRYCDAFIPAPLALSSQLAGRATIPLPPQVRHTPLSLRWWAALPSLSFFPSAGHTLPPPTRLSRGQRPFSSSRPAPLSLLSSGSPPPLLVPLGGKRRGWGAGAASPDLPVERRFCSGARWSPPNSRAQAATPCAGVGVASSGPTAAHGQS